MINNITGYAGFKSYGDKPYSRMKPGQAQLDRDYYKDATAENPDGAQVLSNYGRFQSIYDQNQNKNVHLGDYQVPAKSANTMVSYELIHNPQLYNSSKLGRDEQFAKSHGFESKMKKSSYGSMTLTNAGATVSKNVDPTGHWKSSYKNIVDELAEKERIVSRRPLWSINRQAYTSSRGSYTSEFADAFGKHGDKPRDIMPHASMSQTHKKNELTVGTTQVTTHIPGYNGFIPATDTNLLANQQALGESTRMTIIKQNIVENQNVRLPGYAGHKPMSVVNDRGSLRPSCLDTKGEAFHS